MVSKNSAMGNRNFKNHPGLDHPAPRRQKSNRRTEKGSLFKKKNIELKKMTSFLESPLTLEFGGSIANHHNESKCSVFGASALE